MSSFQYSTMRSDEIANFLSFVSKNDKNSCFGIFFDKHDAASILTFPTFLEFFFSSFFEFGVSDKVWRGNFDAGGISASLSCCIVGRDDVVMRIDDDFFFFSVLFLFFNKNRFSVMCDA